MEAFRSLWRRDGEAGFSILESVVALVIVFGSMLVLFRSLDSSIRVVNESRRQTAAIALASELLERARSLEWDNVGLTGASNDADCPTPVPADGVSGVACADWATEFGVTPDGLGGYLFEGERIVFANGPTFDPFLSFNDQQLRDNVTYDRFLFVTQQTDVAGEERYRKITAIVQWDPPNGFRREIRQVTYASAFEAPPSPVLDANVDFFGGAVSITGYMGGTSGWLDAAYERPLLIDGTFFRGPTAHARATTDYVSAADIEVSSPSSEWVWDGAVAAFRSRIDADVFTLASDDHFGTSAPPSPADTVNLDLVRWQAPGVVPSPPNYMLFGLEWSDGGAAQNTEVIKAVAHAQDASDGLPLVELDVNGAGSFGFGTPEYGAALAASYGESIGSYDFIPVHYGRLTSGTALDYDARIDRFSTTDASRKIDTTFSLASQEVLFLYDTVLAKNSTKFEGWMKVVLPSVSGSLSAGEAALAPSLVTGNVTINVWDTVTNNYVTIFGPTNLASMGAIPPVVSSTAPLVLTPGSTAGILNWPDIFEQVTIEELSVNNPVLNQDFYLAGATAGAQIQVPPIVTGTIHYYAEDTKLARVLFDYTLVFQLPGVTASSAYINPDL
ncbi:MAG: type II secretion system protein [Acidimicrobiia bacterium]|nr:type II secretion system protein [Acidimicrobiia bacterium]